MGSDGTASGEQAQSGESRTIANAVSVAETIGRQPLPSVSVVICAYTEERWEALLRAVQSVLGQTQPPIEIIIVIDHNDQLMARTLNRFQHIPQVALLANEQARRLNGANGANGARNTGVARARGEIVAFLDDDAVAAPNWLEQLSAAYADDCVVAVGGSIIPDWQHGKPDWFPEEFNWVVGCTYRGMPQCTTRVRNLIACNMSIRRVLWEHVGGFRVDIGHVGGEPRGCDETEFFIRAHQHWPNGIILYEPAAQVVHSVTDARSQWRYFRRRCRLEGRSKALIAHIVGAQQALATERAYALATLPRGVLRGIRTSLRDRKKDGITQSAVILSGLAITSTNYMLEAVLRRVLPTLRKPSERP